MSVDKFVERYVAVITFYNFSLRLQGADYAFNSCGLLLSDFRDLIKEDNVAEFNLFDVKIFDILFVDFHLL